MLDIRLIRENPDKINELLKRRNPELSIDEVIEIDVERRKIQTQADELRAKRKSESQKIGELKKKGENTDAIQEDVRKIGDEIKSLEEKQTELDEKQRTLLLHIPNIPDETTPIGASEDDNVEVYKWGEPRKFDFEVKDHVDIAMGLDILDIERAVRMSRTRFSLMKGKGAALERALINFMLKKHTSEHGYTEYVPPILVNGRTMTGTGQLPKFEEDLFKTTDDPALYLIPTAEVPLTNIYREEIIPENMLPLYCTAYTPCFRSEAGSYGRDMRGLIRQHQFDKVELVKICAADKSKEEHEKMLKDAESILQALELPYRVVVLSSGDIGNAAYKTFDIEVWLPSQNMYREISSVSNCWDYQSRRMQMRTRRNGKTELVHTLNGSGIAVGRTWIAILENYQQADGSVIIPDALRPFTGFDKIEKVN